MFRVWVWVGVWVLGFGVGTLNSHAGQAYITFTSVALLLLVHD